MRPSLLLTLSMLVPQSLWADTLFNLEDYAWHAQIEANDATLQRIDLTEPILQGMAHPQAKDIAVFDSDGQNLPTRLRPKPSLETADRITLDFRQFERTEATGSSATITLDSQQHSDGENPGGRISIRQPLPIRQLRRQYLIELTEEQQGLNIEGIELRWDHQPANTMLTLKVEVANDLDHWRTLNAAKTMISDESDAQGTDMLTGLPRSYRFVRLTPTADIDRFNLHAVTAVVRKRQPADAVRLSEPQLLATDEHHPGFYQVHQPLAVHASALRFQLPSGYFLSGTLFTGEDFERRRRIYPPVKQHNVAELPANAWIDISVHDFRAGWFQPQQELPQSVLIEFAYPALELFFINNGRGPFTLAWGNYEQRTHQDRVSAMLTESSGVDYGRASDAEIGKIIEIAGAARQSAPRTLPWMTWLLWSLLVIAVLITGRMADTLYRDLNRS